MVHDAGAEGVYLFLFDKLEEVPCFADHWFTTVGDAKKSAEESFGIQHDDWKQIPDPDLGAAHDLIERK